MASTEVVHGWGAKGRGKIRVGCHRASCAAAKGLASVGRSASDAGSGEGEGIYQRSEDPCSLSSTLSCGRLTVVLED